MSNNIIYLSDASDEKKIILWFVPFSLSTCYFPVSTTYNHTCCKLFFVVAVSAVFFSKHSATHEKLIMEKNNSSIVSFIRNSDDSMENVQ